MADKVPSLTADEFQVVREALDLLEKSCRRGKNSKGAMFAPVYDRQLAVIASARGKFAA